MERIPFNIKYRPEIEAGKYLVQTRDGKSAWIFCWGKEGAWPITAELKVGGSTFMEEDYCVNGHYNANDDESNLDLFLVANPDYKEPTTEPSASSEPSVDWDAFRREASLQIAAGFATNGNFLERSIGQISEDIADCAVVTADMLIKKLKEGTK